MKPTSGRSPIDILDDLTKTIREFSRDIEQLELARNEDNATIRELEIGVLKGPLTSLWLGKARRMMTYFHMPCLAKTRKEEIARFDKARSDVEFGKMMRARILSPEQTELQSQLRRDMRVSQKILGWTPHLYISSRAYYSLSRIGSQKWKIIYKTPKRSSMSSRQESPASSK
jgi:hypothetical protein